MNTAAPEAPAATPTREIDESTVALIDSLDDPACEYGAASPVIPACGKAAAWIMLISCGDTVYVCSEHKPRLQATLDAAASMGCARHDNVDVTVEWCAL